MNQKQIIVTVRPSLEINGQPQVDVQVSGFVSPSDILGVLNFLSGQIIGQIQQQEAAAAMQQVAKAIQVVRQ